MKMKRLLAMGISAAMLFTLTACGGGADNSSGGTGAGGDAGSSSAGAPSIFTIYATGSDNVRSVYEKLTTDFNTNSEYAGTYTAKLQFVLSGTGAAAMRDMLVSAYKANQTNTDFDLVDLGDEDRSYCLSQGDEGMFVALDKSKIPNAANVAATTPDSPELFQPYRGTTVVLAYNSEAVPEPPQTMDELVAWMQANPGRFAYNAAGTGGAGDSFIRSSIYNLIDDESALMSSDPKWMDEWDAGFEFLKSIHPYMYKSGNTIMYPNKNQGTLDLLSSKEIDMCPAWADMVLSQRKAGTLPESVKISTITPSFTGSVQALGMPSFGSQSDAAYAFLNYMLSPEAQQIMVDDMAAIPLIETSELNLEGVEDLGTLDVSNFRTQAIGELLTDLNKRWDDEIGAIG